MASLWLECRKAENDEGFRKRFFSFLVHSHPPLERRQEVLRAMAGSAVITEESWLAAVPATPWERCTEWAFPTLATVLALVVILTMSQIDLASGTQANAPRWTAANQNEGANQGKLLTPLTQQVSVLSHPLDTPPVIFQPKATHTGNISSAVHVTIANIRAEAESGVAKSQYELGNAYFYGKLGMAKDYVEAVQWFRKSAEQNFVKAQMTLGVCYGVGYGVTKDDAQAMQWYRKAADQNFAAAQSTLSSRYERGEGVERDVVEAYKWILLAAGHGSSNAKRHLNTLEGSMTSEQIAEGKRRTNDWRKQHNF